MKGDYRMLHTDYCQNCHRETTGPLFSDNLGRHLVCQHCGASFDTAVDSKLYKERMLPMYRYYTTQRPPMPGSIPKDGLISVVSFDRRTRVEHIGECWGYAMYKHRLTPAAMKDYELRQTPDQAEMAIKAEEKRNVTITRKIAGKDHTFVLTDEEEQQAHALVEKVNIAEDVRTYISECDTWGFDSSEFDGCVYSHEDLLNYESIRLEVVDFFNGNYDSNLDHWANIENAIRAFIGAYKC